MKNNSSSSKPSVSIVIPCYNERENVSGMRETLLPVAHGLSDRWNVQLVFVDDGSSDNTWDALIDAFGGYSGDGLVIRLERHPENRGIGAALRTGIAAAQGEIVVTTDSDGTYRYELIPDLLEELGEGVHVVTASPYHPLGAVEGVPAYRLILSRGSSLLYRILVEWEIYTYTAVFRAYRREIFNEVGFKANGFLACAEILVNAKLAGFTVREFPAVLRVREFGISKAKLLQTTLEHLRFMGSIVGRRLSLRTERPAHSSNP
jgi:dolichol-phosphate mannosyltransferase